MAYEKRDVIDWCIKYVKARKEWRRRRMTQIIRHGTWYLLMLKYFKGGSLARFYRTMLSLVSTQEDSRLATHEMIGIAAGYCVVAYIYVGDRQHGGIITYYIPSRNVDFD
jgi:hypothetical protein